MVTRRADSRLPRVAFIAGTYDPARCGVVHYTERLRTELARCGVESIVLTSRDAARGVEDPTVLRVVDAWGPGCLPPLVRALRSLNPDLLHIQHAGGSYGWARAIVLLPALLRAGQWHSPIVTTVHEYGQWDWRPRRIPVAALEWLKTLGQSRGWWDREDGFLLTLSDRIIVTNPDAERAILDRVPVLTDRLSTIPLAANVEVVPDESAAARQAVRSEAGWPDDAIVLAFFGFLHPVKGLETLLSAFARVNVLAPKTRLLLIGGVESLALRGEHAERYRDELRERIAALGLAGTVRMTGYLPEAEVSRMLAGADLGVLPFNDGVTLKSGSLLTLLGHGIPTVASRHEPPDPELVDADLVRLVPPRDPGALADALLDLSADAPERERLAVAGLRFVGERTWPAIAKRHLEIYDEALRCNRTRWVARLSPALDV